MYLLTCLFAIPAKNAGHSMLDSPDRGHLVYVRMATVGGHDMAWLATTFMYAFRHDEGNILLLPPPSGTELEPATSMGAGIARWQLCGGRTLACPSPYCMTPCRVITRILSPFSGHA